MNKLFEGLFIFEMANSHQGNLDHGIKIIKEFGLIAKKYGINAGVKLQYRNLPDFIHKKYRNSKNVAHVQRFLETQLEDNDFFSMVECIKSEGMTAICTPFDEQSVDLCIEHEIDIIKVASCSADDWPLLEKIAKTGKPLIISTGGKTLADIDKLYSFCNHRSMIYAFLHCVAIYPAGIDMLQLDHIDKMKKRYSDVMIGYSGHEDPENSLPNQLAVAKGAQILERHVGLPTEAIKLNAYSLTPGQADKWIADVLTARRACGLKGVNQSKLVSKEEQDSLLSLQRGVYIRKQIKRGERIYEDNVYFAMPLQEGKLKSGNFSANMVASHDYQPDEALSEKKEENSASIVRYVLHSVKGMLNEAQIRLTEDFEITVSHHYGRKNLLKTGCVMIDIVNCEYCKKLIVILPGQLNPSHYHKIKKETFHLLYGEMVLEINGKVQSLCCGQIVTIEQAIPHSFWSETGAIFEEISTTHYKNDSVYLDDRINKMDVIDRKTSIKSYDY